MHNVNLPSANDYSKIQILVHPLDNLDPLVLNRVLQRLRSAEIIEVSDNPLRFAKAKFVASVTDDTAKFGEFQVFRKIFGVISIGTMRSDLLAKCNNSTSSQLTSSCSDISDEESEFYKTMRQEYDEIKASHEESIVRSQCILLGCDKATDYFDSHELLMFPRLDDAEELELGVRELIRSIYIVLESRRINNAFEKMDTPPCPALVDEEKYSIGTDNIKSKSYKRKCIGRNRKILADYALLTGLPTLALDAYDSAIDYLHQVSDYLWLAAALEGWCCAAMLIKFKEKFDQINTSNGIRRVLTAEDSQYTKSSQRRCRHFNDRVNEPVDATDVATLGAAKPFAGLYQSNNELHALDISANEQSLGRHNSASSILYSDNNVDSTKCTETGDLIPRRYALANSNSVSSATSPNDSKTQSIASVIPSTKRQNLSVSYEDIIKKFSQALENYGKFSFASRVQCDCIVRNVDVFIFRRAYIEAEAFIHERMAVLLDDKFAYFNNQMKAHICLICAAVCTKIGFRRKTAFYMRLSVLFQLNVASSNPVSDSNDYKTIYPLLYQSLKGYGLNDNRVDLVGGRWPDVDTPIITTTFSPIPHHTDAWNGCSATTKNVPFAIQIKAVSEVFISASRAGFYDVAIRHICFILQKYFEYMGMDEVLEKISELHKLVEMYGSVHSLAQPISLYEHNIVLPPVEFNRFPQLKPVGARNNPKYAIPTVKHGGGFVIVWGVFSRDGVGPIVQFEGVMRGPAYRDILNRYMLPYALEQMPDDWIFMHDNDSKHTSRVVKDWFSENNAPKLEFFYDTPKNRHSADFNICPLMEYLSPTIVDAAASKIFIYSPFQDRKKRKEVLWVVDCPCEVFISVSNPLPVELVVKNLTLIVSGCRFESNPIRLNLPSCYGADISPNPPEIKVTGIPRSAGTLKITGYSCEILGVKTVCSLLDNNEIDKMKIKNRECVNYVSKSLSVRVLEKLPLLTLETSLKMTPTTTTLLAEATVFSGQMLHHLIYLHNTSDEMTVERVAIKIQQPVVYGGPNLIDVLDTLDVRNILPGERREIRIKIFGIDPAANPTCNQNGSSNSSNTNGGQTAITHNSIPSVNLLGEEHRVYVRRNTSLSIVQSEMSDTSSVLSLPHPNNNFKNADVASTKLFASKHEPNSITPNGFFNNSSASLSASSVEPSSIYQGTSEQQSSSYKSELSQLSVPSLSANLSQKEKNDSVDSIKATDCVGSSNIAITNDGEGHDLIPYIGRLLSAEFAFTYTITSVSTENERYERVVRLPLAVAIVPAVNVVDWHILSGDGPSTRYVVVDVTNSTDVNAELTYDNGRMMWVQPKEVCRVPLLCPCCTEISSATFIAAMQLESHMMQMREIERLRKTLEKHISRYLDIRWSIPALSLNGLVPVGSLLSSVAFLKQLVIPEISVCIQVNDSTYISEDDVVVGIGELVQFKVTILVSTKLDSLNGIVALRCYQDLQNSQLQKINRDENIILFGPSRIPFCIRGKDSSAKENISPDENAKKKSLTSSMSSFEVTFAFAFRFEGIHKIRPEIIDQTTLSNRHVPPHSKRFTDETIFIPYASFNVVSKA